MYTNQLQRPLQQAFLIYYSELWVSMSFTPLLLVAVWFNALCWYRAYGVLATLPNQLLARLIPYHLSWQKILSIKFYEIKQKILKSLIWNSQNFPPYGIT